MITKAQENILINRRMKVILFLFFMLFVILSIRIIHLQIVDYDKYNNLSIRNVIKERSITPTRAVITDRNGFIIADNRPMYYLTITPELVNNYKKFKNEAVLKTLEDLRVDVDISDEEIEKIMNDIKKNPKFIETIVKLDVNSQELSKIINKIKFLSGIKVNSTFVRNYPEKDLFLQPIGYVGLASREDFNKYKGLTNLDYVGKSGIEKTYQEELHGEHGTESYRINATGRVIQTEIKKRPVAGKEFRTTLDMALQKKAFELMGEEKGAVVAIDPNNGDILAMVSTPTFDANKFISGISKAEYEEHFSKSSPLLNRTIQGTYPPASTFKPFVALAALEGRFISSREKVMCGPYYQIKGSSRKFLDWKKWGHGEINLAESLERSADVYYYKLGYEMGIDYMHDFIKHFGFGKKTGIELDGEKAGLLPSTAWKMKTKKEAWYNGESVISSIGQGYNLATPLQMATSMASLLNGGTLYKPRLNLNEEIVINDKINLNKANVEEVKKGLADVLHGKQGTARMAIYGDKKINFRMGGKTGTAQVYSTHGVKDKETMDNMPKHLKDHAMFVGFAPYDNPKIVIAVVVENGESGSRVAAPVAVEMARYYVENLKE